MRTSTSVVVINWSSRRRSSAWDWFLRRRRRRRAIWAGDSSPQRYQNWFLAEVGVERRLGSLAEFGAGDVFGCCSG